MNDKKRITRSEVAKLAGVSGGTVARVLCGHKEVAEATRKRVQQAIEALGYQPNLIARSLRSGRTNQLGLIVPDEKNLFFHGIISGVGQKAAEAGYSMVLVFSKWGYRSILDTLVGRRVDAVITCIGGGGSDELEALFSSGIPACTCGYVLPDLPHVASVVPDYVGAGRLSAEHIIKSGHKRIALFPGGIPEGLQPSERMRGWYAAMGDAGLEPVVDMPGYWSYDSGEGMAKAAVEAGVTAAVFESDFMAMGFISALNRMGLRVPEDISTVSIDDVWLAKDFRPALTTVSLFPKDLGIRATEMALDLVKGESPGNAITPVELIVRETTTNLT